MLNFSWIGQGAALEPAHTNMQAGKPALQPSIDVDFFVEKYRILYYMFCLYDF